MNEEINEEESFFFEELNISPPFKETSRVIKESVFLEPTGKKEDKGGSVKKSKTVSSSVLKSNLPIKTKITVKEEKVEDKRKEKKPYDEEKIREYMKKKKKETAGQREDEKKAKEEEKQKKDKVLKKLEDYIQKSFKKKLETVTTSPKKKKKIKEKEETHDDHIVSFETLMKKRSKTPTHSSNKTKKDKTKKKVKTKSEEEEKEKPKKVKKIFTEKPKNHFDVEPIKKSVSELPSYESNDEKNFTPMKKEVAVLLKHIYSDKTKNSNSSKEKSSETTISKDKIQPSKLILVNKEQISIEDNAPRTAWGEESEKNKLRTPQEDIKSVSSKKISSNNSTRESINSKETLFEKRREKYTTNEKVRKENQLRTSQESLSSIKSRNSLTESDIRNINYPLIETEYIESEENIVQEKFTSRFDFQPKQFVGVTDVKAFAQQKLKEEQTLSHKPIREKKEENEYSFELSDSSSTPRYLINKLDLSKVHSSNNILSPRSAVSPRLLAEKVKKKTPSPNEIDLYNVINSLARKNKKLQMARKSNDSSQSSSISKEIETVEVETQVTSRLEEKKVIAINKVEEREISVQTDSTRNPPKEISIQTDIKEEVYEPKVIPIIKIPTNIKDAEVNTSPFPSAKRKQIVEQSVENVTTQSKGVSEELQRRLIESLSFFEKYKESELKLSDLKKTKHSLLEKQLEQQIRREEEAIIGLTRKVESAIEGSPSRNSYKLNESFDEIGSVTSSDDILSISTEYEERERKIQSMLMELKALKSKKKKQERKISQLLRSKKIEQQLRNIKHELFMQEQQFNMRQLEENEPSSPITVEKQQENTAKYLLKPPTIITNSNDKEPFFKEKPKEHENTVSNTTRENSKPSDITIKSNVYQNHEKFEQEKDTEKQQANSQSLKSIQSLDNFADEAYVGISGNLRKKKTEIKKEEKLDSISNTPPVLTNSMDEFDELYTNLQIRNMTNSSKPLEENFVELKDDFDDIIDKKTIKISEDKITTDFHTTKNKPISSGVNLPLLDTSDIRTNKIESHLLPPLVGNINESAPTDTLIHEPKDSHSNTPYNQIEEKKSNNFGSLSNLSDISDDSESDEDDENYTIDINSLREPPTIQASTEPTELFNKDNTDEPILNQDEGFDNIEEEPVNDDTNDMEEFNNMDQDEHQFDFNRYQQPHKEQQYLFEEKTPQSNENSIQSDDSEYNFEDIEYGEEIETNKSINVESNPTKKENSLSDIDEFEEDNQYDNSHKYEELSTFDEPKIVKDFMEIKNGDNTKPFSPDIGAMPQIENKEEIEDKSTNILDQSKTSSEFNYIDEFDDISNFEEEPVDDNTHEINEFEDIDEEPQFEDLKENQIVNTSTSENEIDNSHHSDNLFENIDAQFTEIEEKSNNNKTENNIKTPHETSNTPDEQELQDKEKVIINNPNISNEIESQEIEEIENDISFSSASSKYLEQFESPENKQEHRSPIVYQDLPAEEVSEIFSPPLLKKNELEIIDNSFSSISSPEKSEKDDSVSSTSLDQDKFTGLKVLREFEQDLNDSINDISADEDLIQAEDIHIEDKDDDDFLEEDTNPSSLEDILSEDTSSSKLGPLPQIKEKTRSSTIDCSKEYVEKLVERILTSSGIDLVKPGCRCKLVDVSAIDDEVNPNQLAFNTLILESINEFINNYNSILDAELSCKKFKGNVFGREVAKHKNCPFIVTETRVFNYLLENVLSSLELSRNEKFVDHTLREIENEYIPKHSIPVIEGIMEPNPKWKSTNLEEEIVKTHITDELFEYLLLDTANALFCIDTR
ncbi:hypothetical protein ABK040_003675 [Willaertia magna]